MSVRLSPQLSVREVKGIGSRMNIASLKGDSLKDLTFSGPLFSLSCIHLDLSLTSNLSEKVGCLNRCSRASTRKAWWMIGTKIITGRMPLWVTVGESF